MKGSRHSIWSLLCALFLFAPTVSALVNSDPGNGQKSFSFIRRQVVSSLAILPFSPLLPVQAEELQKITFQTLEDGVKVATIRIGSGSSAIQPDSKVNIHLTGRLLGKNGWIFENSQQDDDPYRLQLGAGTVVPGLEEGLLGMVEGDRRRIVVPSNRGYLNKTLEPIPRDFGNRQRLYTTVMNSVRIDRERSQLGSDLAGMVVFDVELLRIRN
jgi:hypothetical protein